MSRWWVAGSGAGCRCRRCAPRGSTWSRSWAATSSPPAYKAGKLGIPHARGSLTEALALPDVDAVAIATPPHTHFELALEAVTAGRHVLCEKPFTTDAAQARQLADAAEHAGVVGTLGHEFRWNPARAAIGAAIASGAIGAPRLATIVEYSPFLLQSDDSLAMPSWFEEPGIGGWLGANGSHTLDQLRVWLGPFRSVSASMLVSAGRPRSRGRGLVLGSVRDGRRGRGGAPERRRGVDRARLRRRDRHHAARSGSTTARPGSPTPTAPALLPVPNGSATVGRRTRRRRPRRARAATRSATTSSSPPRSSPPSRGARSTRRWRCRPSPTGSASCRPWTPCGPRPPPAAP